MTQVQILDLGGEKSTDKRVKKLDKEGKAANKGCYPGSYPCGRSCLIPLEERVEPAWISRTPQLSHLRNRGVLEGCSQEELIFPPTDHHKVMAVQFYLAGSSSRSSCSQTNT